MIFLTILSLSSITPVIHGAVEKSRQRYSRHFSVLTSCQDVPCAKVAAAFPSTLSGQAFSNRPNGADSKQLPGEIQPFSELFFLSDFSSQPESFTLVTLAFDTIGLGTSDLTFSQGFLGDAFGIGYQRIATDMGSVTVEGGWHAGARPQYILASGHGPRRLGVSGNST